MGTTDVDTFVASSSSSSTNLGVEAQASTNGVSGRGNVGGPHDFQDPRGIDIPTDSPASPGRRNSRSCSDLDDVEVEPLGLGGRVETLHLVDASPSDLLGLWEPLCPRLQKMVL